jgi:hypothetical protein
MVGDFLQCDVVLITELTSLIPPLFDFHIVTGFTTKLLKEAISDRSSTVEHLEFLLFDMRMEVSITPHFNASSVSPASLLQKDVFSLNLYKELADCGMTVTSQCCAVRGRLRGVFTL